MIKDIACWMVVLIVLSIVCSVVMHANPTVYKITPQNRYEVGISCNNGADPTGTKIGDMVVISCGKD